MHFPGPYEVFFAMFFKVAFFLNGILFLIGLALLLYSVLRNKGIKSTILVSTSGPAIVLHGITTIFLFSAILISVVTSDMPANDLTELVMFFLFMGIMALPSIAGLFIWVALRMRFLTSSDLPSTVLPEFEEKA